MGKKPVGYNKKLKLESILASWSKWSAEHVGRASLIMLAITIIAVVGISMLKMEMSFYSIMPRASQKVEDLQLITEHFPSASTIIAVVEGEDPQALRDAVGAIEQELGTPDYEESVATIVGSIPYEEIDGSLLFTAAGDLLNDGDSGFGMLSDLENPAAVIALLNDELTELLAKDSLSSLESKHIRQVLEEVHCLISVALYNDSPQRPDAMGLAFHDVADTIMIPERYFINEDETMALVFIRPTFTVNDIFILTKQVESIERGVKQFEEVYGVSIGLTGLPVVAKDEAVSSEKGLAVSSFLAFMLIIGLMILNFRMKSIPLLTGLPLLLGIVWTVGIVGFLLGRLNIMTAMYVVALLGLGVDFAIHYITSFFQERETGKSFIDSLTDGVLLSGRGIVIGALTTACAFYALVLAESELIKELAIVAGTGILCELLVMFFLLPVLLSLREKWIKKHNRKETIIRQRSSYSALATVGRVIAKFPFVFFIICVGVILIVGIHARRVEVETNIMNMEAEGLESILLQDRMVAKFDMAPDSLYIYSESIEETVELTRKLKELELVSDVDSISELVPPMQDQMDLARMIRDGLDAYHAAMETQGTNGSVYSNEELQLRIGLLIDNLRLLARKAGYEKQVEFTGELNTIFRSSGTMMLLYRDLSRAITEYMEAELTSGFITLESMPVELVNDYFVSGEFLDFPDEANLITVIPKANLWVSENRTALYAQLDGVTDKATGMVMAADQMNQIARSDSVKAATAALVVIFIILLLDFRNVKLAVLTMLPLVAALITLLGFMGWMDIKFDFINIIAIPLLIGIGIDDAVHVSHRYRLTGAKSIEQVIAKIGRAIGMTTITTVIGFASFIPSIMRAMRSTGIVLTIAMFLAFGFTLFLHGPLLIIVRERLGMNISAWNDSKNR